MLFGGLAENTSHGFRIYYMISATVMGIVVYLIPANVCISCVAFKICTGVLIYGVLIALNYRKVA